MEQIYLTNEVAKVLDLSIATVRNYAKYLERSGHEFHMKKQARLWTDIEINLIKEIQQFYSDNDYPLETCFDYIVKKHQDGSEAAQKILDDATPLQVGIQSTPPEIEYLKGIQDDTKSLITMFSDLKEQIPDKQFMIEHQKDPDTYQNELNELEQKYKSDIESLKNDNEKLNDELAELQKEKDKLTEQIQAIESMSTWEFWKHKR